MLEDVNDEIPLFTEREQETVLEGEPIGTKVTQVNAIDKDGTYPNNEVSVVFFVVFIKNAYVQELVFIHFGKLSAFTWFIFIFYFSTFCVNSVDRVLTCESTAFLCFVRKIACCICIL